LFHCENCNVNLCFFQPFRHWKVLLHEDNLEPWCKGEITVTTLQSFHWTVTNLCSLCHLKSPRLAIFSHPSSFF
jgi:hypothetical protein